MLFGSHGQALVRRINHKIYSLIPKLEKSGTRAWRGYNLPLYAGITMSTIAS